MFSGNSLFFLGRVDKKWSHRFFLEGGWVVHRET